MIDYADKLKIYDEVVEKCKAFKRKGKTMPYTSANGHMFSQLNKEGELGIRFSKELQEKYIKELNTTYFRSYGAIMRGYILIPEELWQEADILKKLLMESHQYILTLEPK